MTAFAPTPPSPDRWRRAFAAADRALDLSAGAQDAFIARCCVDDPALGADVRALLASAVASSRLDVPAAVLATPYLATLSSDREDVAPSAIGPYRLVREVGRGGMGRVYLAERAGGPHRKQVALKLLSRWWAGHADHVQRSIEERQILAALEHPGIARLLDGGVTADGLPWFTMEYVEGEPIDRYCDERCLTIEQRLEVIDQVCAAVAYAHRKFVVHRDLKPGNILVSGDGEVKLLDFGIAKLSGPETNATATHTGDHVMTPLYASPEQIRGRAVSAASDVYALGVLLYGLLAGRYPYRPATSRPHDVVRAILEQDAERPSASVFRVLEHDSLAATRYDVARLRGTVPAKLVRRLSGDLDAIVLKAIEKDLRRRYSSVEQLQADLRRHLAGLPVIARPANRLYRARGFVARSPRR